MTKGLEIRAQIDSENVKGLLLINGGGAVALLAFLPSVLGKPEFLSFTCAILWALFSFQIGLLAAVIHNHLRRRYSLEYERHGYKPPGGSLFGIPLQKPGICIASHAFMWLSVSAFVIAGLLVLQGGLKTLNNISSTPHVMESSKTDLKNRPKN